jgi:lipoprotein NlpI
LVNQEGDMRFSVMLVALSALFVIGGPVLLSQAAVVDAVACVHRIGDEQIAACTRAIQSGRWSGQGLARVYPSRGIAYRAKGDPDRAMADYNEVMRLDPKLATAYRDRGLEYLFGGKLAKALADVSQASEFNPKDAYTALWVDIIRQRNNFPSRLPEAILKIDMTAWPAPVIRLFLGEMTSDAVLAAADDPNAAKKKGQLCVANFYSGELALRRSAKDEAVRLFQLAQSDCPHTFIEWDAANAELRVALGAARP